MTLERGLLLAVSASTPAPPLVPAWATGHPARQRQGVTWCLLWQA
jgi:hypothetical protein